MNSEKLSPVIPGNIACATTTTTPSAESSSLGELLAGRAPRRFLRSVKNLKQTLTPCSVLVLQHMMRKYSNSSRETRISRNPKLKDRNILTPDLLQIHVRSVSASWLRISSSSFWLNSSCLTAVLCSLMFLYQLVCVPWLTDILYDYTVVPMSHSLLGMGMGLMESSGMNIIRRRVIIGSFRLSK